MEKPTLAETWQEGQLAEWSIEDKIVTLLGLQMDTLDHITTDHYDNSVELFFTPQALSSFILNDEQREGIIAMGFDHGWCNFTDGTECHFGRIYPGERKAVNRPRWTLDEYERKNHLDHNN